MKGFWKELKLFWKAISNHPMIIVYIASYCVVAYAIGVLLGVLVGIVWVIINLILLL